MNTIYGMRRANGDWFAVDDRGRLRVPVFYSAGEAMEARWCNPGMLLFKPVMVDELALGDLAPTASEESAGYWLVSNPSLNLRRGRPLDHEQLVLLVRDSAQQPQE